MKELNILEEVILSLEESKASLVTAEEKKRLQDFISILGKQKKNQMNRISEDVVRIAAVLPRLLDPKNERFMHLLGEVLKPTELIFPDKLSRQLVFEKRTITNVESPDVERSHKKRIK